MKPTRKTVLEVSALLERKGFVVRYFWMYFLVLGLLFFENR